MSNSRVTFLSKLTVVSSRPVTSGKAHTLSALDCAMSSHTLHYIFYYKNESRWFESFGLDPLRESLSKVLTMYPTITGRLARGQDDKWEVKCNDAGVRVIMATVGVTIDEWLKSASGSEEKLLTAWDDMPQDPTTWSPFQIQINSFEGGGIAIGLSCSHMVADLTFLASFFKSWTQVHSYYPITNPPIVIPLPAHAKIGSLHSHARTPSPTNMPTASFKFSSSIIKQHLSKIQHKCPNATPFDFLAALFWTRISQVKPPKTHSQSHSLTFCTDIRSIIKPYLPTGFFGNALGFSTLSQTVNDIQRKQLGSIVSEVHSHLKRLSEEKTFSTMKVNICCVYGAELTCVCMEHLVAEENESMLYSSVFEDKEKPMHVSCQVGNVLDEGLIIVMASSEGGFGRTVTVMLPEEELVKLCKDETILEFKPEIFLAGSVLDC